MADGRVGLRLPVPPGTVRRRAAWYRTWSLGTALTGFLVLLLAVSGLAAVPELVDDERAFEAAVPCAPPAAAGGDCLRSVEATVVYTVIRDGAKYEEFTLGLTGPREVPRELDMGHADPLLEHLRPGDRVTVTRWRDYTTAVTRDGVTQESADTPAGEPQLVTALMLVLLSGGTYALYAGGVVLARARHYAERGLPISLVTFGKQAFGAALCAPVALVVGYLAGPLAVAAVWLATLPLVHLAVRRSERRGRGRHAAAPGYIR